MAEIGSKRKQSRSHASERLLVAIGYPERMPNADGPFTLRVDGKEVLVEESAGRIVLSHVLTEDDSMIPMLAAYAAGRMLREDAVLAYGRWSKVRKLKVESLESDSRLPDFQISTFLWQDAPEDSDDRTLVRLFETFVDSCDWWRARVEERRKGDAVEISEAVIRP